MRKDEGQDVELQAEDDESEVLYEHRQIKVDPAQALLRIDKFLMSRLPATTRNKVQAALRAGFITVNGREIKPNYKVRALDEIVVSMPEPPRTSEILAEDIPLDIFYEDEDFLIVNKKPNMVVHPATDNWTGTMVNALLHHFEKSNTEFHGLVHRIDKDTSGLLVVPKNEFSKLYLSKLFFKHTIHRRYLAIVWGEPELDEGTIISNIARSKNDRRVFESIPENSERGRRAVTHYKVLERLRYVSLIECRLETGRTHQIRVHMKSIGHPLFADSFYGGDKILRGSVYSKYRAFVENSFNILNRQALHAKSLGFVHPTTQKEVHFESDLPKDFTDVLERWKVYVQSN